MQVMVFVDAVWSVLLIVWVVVLWKWYRQLHPPNKPKS